jgi:DNA-binding NtrC family response regulator
VLLPALTAASPATTGSPEAASDGAAAVRRSTVLLVDDEEMVRQVGVAMLQRLGHNVMVASNGDEALALYRAAPGEVSCVILDLTMPGPDSAAVLHAMRSINPHLPVIVTSGFAEPDAAAGVADDVAFLQKPYELPRLRDILRGVLPSAEAERAVRVR